MRFVCALFALFMIAPAFAGGTSKDHQQQTVSSVSIERAWVRAVPPVSKNTAGYLTLKNNSDQELVLVGVESARARVVELHNVIKKGQMMSMTPVSEVVIPAAGQVEFKPGSYHLMFIDLVKPVKISESIEVELLFKNGKRSKVGLPVQAGEGMAEHHHHHH